MRCRSSIPRLFSANAAILIWSLTLAACGSSGNTYTAPSALSKCAVAFEAPATTVPADGGSGAIPVKTERECAWTAEPDVPWLSITAGRSGQGNGTVEFAAAANGDPAARSGGIMLNGLRAQVTQAAAQCRFTLANSAESFSQAGGSGSVDVRASSALCTWTAASDADWIAITSGASGKGSAAVAFNVGPTTGPPRTGTLTIAGLHFSVTQSEGCTYAIAPSAYAAGAAGGSNAVTVAAAAGCPWTASSDVSWISLTTTSGTGSGTVGFTVAATTGPSRSGTVTIAGQVLTVTQSPGCAFDVSPLSHAADASGGSRTVNVSAAAGCAWTATSNAPWITITGGASGNGAGTVTFAVAATTGPARTGTLSVGGQTVTVVQGQGCTYAASPDTQTVPSSGGSGSVSVSAGAGCAWSASSNASWITITSGASGSGSGTVAFTAASTTGPSRSGTITVAGHSVTVVQGQGCTFAISPDTRSVPASGADGTVSVTAGTGCAWTAASNASWITIASGASGSGNGSVSYKVAATSGPARSGSLTIAGRTFTVNQGADCTISLSSSSATVAAGGGTGAFDVRTAAGCGWTAASNASWLTVSAGASGDGNGNVRYAAAANSGPQRTGAIAAGGQTFTVRQDAGCSFSISPASQNVGSIGGNASVGVSAAAGCPWNAESNVPWIGISSGSSGSGNGTVQLVIAANTDAERRGTVTIAGQTFTVVQASGCTFSISSAGQSVPSGGGSGSFSVNAAGACAWTATANASWIAITSGGSGTGAGTVQFTAAANTGAARSGTITAAGQTFTVTQDTGCSPVVAPETIGEPAAGGSQNVSVTTAAECSWTAVSNAVWIAIAAGASGSGNGTVQLDIQANTGPARGGTATIAGRTVSVNQDAGCTFSIAPATQAVPVAGGSGSVTVTAGGGCAWTAVSNVPWVTVTNGGSGSGAGTVEFTVEANATGASRSGTVTIAGQVFTVEQAGS
jgi:Putative binding domain, N-terminal/Viral BACON domain